MGSLITNRDRNCLSCRIVSGGGLVGVGLYLGYYAKKNQSANGKVILFGLGGACVALGAARMLDLPPFKDQFRAQA